MRRVWILKMRAEVPPPWRQRMRGRVEGGGVVGGFLVGIEMGIGMEGLRWRVRWDWMLWRPWAVVVTL